MSSTSAHVLVADDIAANRLVLKRMLEHQGHRVTLAEHGAEALARLRAEAFDLVMLDIMMPVLDGYGVLAALREDAALSRIPVVVVSAVTDMESVAQCVALGAADYLFKPVSPILLKARVETCLAAKRLHDRERAALLAIEATQRAQSEFLALVSHELRNPLAAIRGFADTLRRNGPSLTEQIREECQRSITNLAMHMDALLSDLGDLSRIESSQLRLTPAAIPFARAAQLAIEGVQSLVAAREQRLSLAVEPGLPPLWADELRLVQIITNLLSNAGKYTPQGGTIQLTARARDATTAEISVVDSGIGLSAEEQRRVFERFFRSNDPLVRRERGSGLGLFIARWLVEAQGGQIWCESERGVGTAFRFTLPLADAQQARIVRPAAAPREGRASHSL